MEDKFHKAARDGYLDLLREATKRDANSPNEDGATPTMIAAYSGNLDALRLIIERGGDPDKYDLTGYTALHHAVRNGHQYCAEFLVNFGCNIWALDNDGHSAMDVAALYDRQELMKYLDSAYFKQQRLNPKVVGTLREKSVKKMEENIKRYHHYQEKAQKIARKEHARLEQIQHRGNEFDSVRKPGSLFNKISETLRGSRKTKNTEKRSGPNVFYANSERNSSNVGSNRPGLVDVFGPDITTKTRTGKHYSVKNGETDIFGLDSGNGSSGPDDELDMDENRPSIFKNTMGSFSFLSKGPSLNSALQSLPTSFPDDRDSGVPNGYDDDIDGNDITRNMSSDSIGTASSLVKETPWGNSEMIDDYDDDDFNEYSSLVLFLEICGLQLYTPLFTREKIDLKALMLLSDDDMKQIGLQELGVRRKLMAAIRKREQCLQTAVGLTDTFF
ncbi:hypothetical protein ScPMuIL_003502 [Solemya velum]